MTFQILLGIFPLGAYLTILGWLRWTRPALVTTGGRDTFALALAAIGLAAIGPGDLFFPAAAGAAFGPIVWPVMMLLYFLIVALWVLHQRPRLVIYGLGDKGHNTIRKYSNYLTKAFAFRSSRSTTAPTTRWRAPGRAIRRHYWMYRILMKSPYERFLMEIGGHKWANIG